MAIKKVTARQRAKHETEARAARIAAEVEVGRLEREQERIAAELVTARLVLADKQRIQDQAYKAMVADLAGVPEAPDHPANLRILGLGD